MNEGIDMAGSDDDDETMPTLAEEVAGNEYDWSDPDVDKYDSDDSFLAPEDDSDGGEVSVSPLPRPCDENEEEEITLLTPAQLEAREREGRPRRKRKRPERYSPECDALDRYDYDKLADDDDGEDASTHGGHDDPACDAFDGSAAYSPSVIDDGSCCSSSSGEDEDDDGGDDGEEEEDKEQQQET